MMTLRRQTLSSNMAVARWNTSLCGDRFESLVTVLVDARILARLERERVSLNEADLKTTVRRRLEMSGTRLPYLERDDLLWSPPMRERRSINVQLSSASLAKLRDQAERLDIDEQTLMTGVLSDDLFASPLALLADDAHVHGYLRTERGRGRIYGMRFEVAGYQYAFLKTLAGDVLSPTKILELAIQALAHRIVGGEIPTEMRLSRDALSLALDVCAAASRLNRTKV